MIARHVSWHAIRWAVVGFLRKLLPGRLLFRLLGLPAGTAEVRALQEIPVHGTASKPVPPPKTVDEALHWKFVPGSDPFYRPSGWFFERSFVVPVRHGISRATGVSLTPSGYVIDLGPGLTPPPSTYQEFYRPLARRQHIDDSVVTLTTFWDSNYFHWLFDVLPRLQLVESSGLKPSRIYASLRHGFQRDTLLQLGYTPDTIIDAAVIPHVSATEMVVPSLPGTPGVMPDWVCRFLREKLLPTTAACDGNRLRIYISRASARNRRVVNEPRLLGLLERYDFMVVRLETLSFAEQVRLFQSAGCVVAPHGAGLANLVFCQRGASVVEILPSQETNLCYWLLSQQVSLTYHYVLGSAGGAANDIEVDLDKLERTLEAALSFSTADAALRLTV
jgi:hypothetical protein